MDKILNEDLIHCEFLEKLHKHYSNEDILFLNQEDLKIKIMIGDAIKQMKINKLEIIKKYQRTFSMINDQNHKNIILDIIIDKLIHVHLYDHLLNTLFTTTKITRENIKKSFTNEEASKIAIKLGIDFSKVKFDLDQFRQGLDVELEHGTISPLTNVSNDDEIITGKIALAHLNEIPDYYTRLLKMEQDAKK